MSYVFLSSFLLIFKRSVWVSCLDVCLCIVCVQGHRDQQSMSNTLELECGYTHRETPLETTNFPFQMGANYKWLLG